MKVSIISPAKDEEENIRPLVKGIFAVMPKGTELIIVNDGSRDKTSQIAKWLSKKYNIKVIDEPMPGVGLSPAVIDGLRAASGDIIGVMDADLSHSFDALPMLLKAVKEGADIAIGSRYMTGGLVETWSVPRKIISRGATLMARLLTAVKDPMSGFFFMRRSVIENIKFESKGYKILLEIIAKGNYKSISEVPYTFRGRGIGHSKLNLREYAKYSFDFLRLLGYKAKRAIRKD